MGNEEELEKMVKSLLEAFQSVPDPRGKNGKRHRLPAILAMAVAAMICGARSLYAIYQWGRLQPPEVVTTLGFVKKNGKPQKTPCVATLHRVFKRLDVTRFEAVLRGWSQQNLGDEEALALDGKELRGIHGEQMPGVRLVAVYAVKSGLVADQKGEAVS